jgi:S-adenosylmethionine/arginine decarboxylase-like enzyme
MVEHKHMIVHANVNKPFTDVEKTKDWLRRLVNAIGMKLCKSGGPHVDYVEAEGNCGIAGVAMIETSHVSVHCWDKEKPALAQIDVYSCAPYDPKIVLAYIEEMSPSYIEMMLIDRKNGITLKEFSQDKLAQYNPYRDL